MVKKLRNLVVCVAIGLLIGLWVGVNMGKGRPIFSNPFAGGSVKEKIKRTGEDMLEKGGEALEKSGKAIQKRFNK